MANPRGSGVGTSQVVLRVKSLILEGDFDAEMETVDCVNRCPNCGGVSGSGTSGSGSSGQPLTEPPPAWLAGFQALFCSHPPPPWPPGVPHSIIPTPAELAFLAGLCAAVSAASSGVCFPGSLDPRCLTYRLFIVPIWESQGRPDHYPGVDPGGGGGGTDGTHLVYEWHDFDVPGDTIIVGEACEDIPFCTCDGSGSGK